MSFPGIDRLDKPICFLDCESTSANASSARIVELAVQIVYPDERAPYSRVRRINPGIPIPAEATQVHHITDADVAGEPTFPKIAKALHELLDPCHFIGYAIRRFDLPLLIAEFKRCGLELDYRTRDIIDLQSLFFLREPRDLAAAARRFADVELGEGAHSARADTDVLPLILMGMLERYPDLPRSVDGLHAACDELQPFVGELERWLGADLENPVFQFGKHQGQRLDAVPNGYLKWLLGSDVDAEVKAFVTGYFDRARGRVHGAA